MDPFLPDPKQAEKILLKYDAAMKKEQKMFADSVDEEITSECTCTLCPSRDRLEAHDYCCQALFLYPLLKKGNLLKDGLEKKLKDQGSTPCITEDRLFTERLITDAVSSLHISFLSYYNPAVIIRFIQSTEAAVDLQAYASGHQAKDDNE